LTDGELLPFNIGLTACRRFLHLQQSKLRLSLEQRQTSPRFFTITAPDQHLFLFGLWCFFRPHQSH